MTMNYNPPIRRRSAPYRAARHQIDCARAKYDRALAQIAASLPPSLTLVGDQLWYRADLPEPCAAPEPVTLAPIEVVAIDTAMRRRYGRIEGRVARS